MFQLEYIACVFVFNFAAVHAVEDYCQLPCGKTLNTACERAPLNCSSDPRCGKNFKQLMLTAAEREQIVNRHNYYRNKVATGKEKRGNQPKAANMMAMSYNTDLEYVAQCLTNTCKFGHDTCRRTKSYKHVGQNIFSFSTTAKSSNKSELLDKFVAGWYNEVENYKGINVKKFQSNKSGSKIIGHYTQLVWASSKEFGCGLTFYTSGKFNRYYFVCNYGPTGNYKGASVYEIGETRSHCPSRTNGSEKWPGLC